MSIQTRTLTTTIASASTTVAGKVELATDTEAKAVSSQALAVTPGNLAAVFAEPPALGSTTAAAVNATAVKIGDGTASAPALAFTSDTNTGIYSLGADILAVAAGGAVRLGVASSGISGYAGAFLLPSTGYLGWGNASIGTVDTFVYRDGPNITAQRNSTNAQTLRVYNTYTDASNYERGTLNWSSNVLRIGTEAAGTGTVRNINFIGGAALATAPTGGLGYGAGAGGTVTQATDKSTGVTLNKVTGQITMHNATLNAGAEVGFTVTNSAVAATDVVIVNIASGATADSYHVGVDAVASGSFRVSLTNVSASNLGEALVLNFAVVKGVTS